MATGQKAKLEKRSAHNRLSDLDEGIAQARSQGNLYAQKISDTKERKPNKVNLRVSDSDYEFIQRHKQITLLNNKEKNITDPGEVSSMVSAVRRLCELVGTDDFDRVFDWIEQQEELGNLPDFSSDKG